MNDLEARVRRLERSNRVLTILCVGLLSLPILAGAVAQDRPKPPQLPPGTQGPLAGSLPASAKKFFSDEIQAMMAEDKKVHNVLRTRVLAIVDKDGKIKASVSTDAHGNPMLSMFGRQDTLALSLGLESNRPHCVLYDSEEKPNVALYGMSPARPHAPQLLFAGGGQVVINHKNGTPAARFESLDEFSTLQFNTKEGKDVMHLKHGYNTSQGKRWGYTELVMNCTEKPNSASMRALPTMASVSVNVGESKYFASMTAETFGIVRARSHEPMSLKDQIFSTKWEFHGGRETHSWLVDPKDN